MRNDIRSFIAIIDFGSQYSHLILRNLRELGVEGKIFAPTANISKLQRASGIILSGGPKSVIKKPVPYNPALLKLPLPILGVCYGLQLLARDYGGEVAPGKIREYGLANLRITKKNKLFFGLPPTTAVWMSHGDSVTRLPPQFHTIAATQTLKYAAIAHNTKPIWGVQFHPEVNHTKYGKNILTNFVFDICQLKPIKPTGILEKIKSAIKKQVGKKKVFLLVSGGVDSTVAFALLNKILGSSQVYGLHIDTGLLREQESQKVKKQLAQAGFKNLHIVNASPLFFKKLKNIFEPEEKRQIIGQAFLTAKKQVEQRLKLSSKNWLLGQGTIYPDTIESGGTKHADKIKTHHNRIGILAKLAKQGLLVEPLKELYKDEVRTLGKTLGLSKEIIWAHPFPGPALGVRVLCLNKKTVQKLNRTSSIIASIKYKNRVLPVLSVGVQGDERSYCQPLAIEMPYKKAAAIHNWATQTLNEHRHINRVLLSLSNNKIQSGRSFVASITPKRVKLLRKIDHIVTTELQATNIYYKIWQCPIVLIPFGIKHKESVVLRPFESREAMTGRAYILPAKILQKIVNKIRALNKVDYIFYDLTDKPPGTIEWE